MKQSLEAWQASAKECLESQYLIRVQEARLAMRQAQEQQHGQLEAIAEVAKQTAVEVAKQEVQREADRAAAAVAAQTDLAKQKAAEDAKEAAAVNAKLAADDKNKAVHVAKEAAAEAAKEAAKQRQWAAADEAEKARILRADATAQRVQQGRADAAALKDALQKAQDAESAGEAAAHRATSAENAYAQLLAAGKEHDKQAEANLAQMDDELKASKEEVSRLKMSNQSDVAEAENRVQVCIYRCNGHTAHL